VKYWIGAVVGSLACAGCVPVDFPGTPNLSGTIRDASSKAPIGNAQISLSPLYKPTLEAKTTTDAEEHFDAQALTYRRWIPLLPFDYAYSEIEVKITAANYQNSQQKFSDIMKANNYGQEVIIYLEHARAP
jgi:hypothetical protein